MILSIFNNSEWLVSGVIISLLSAIITLISKLLKYKKNETEKAILLEKYKIESNNVKYDDFDSQQNKNESINRNNDFEEKKKERKKEKSNTILKNAFRIKRHILTDLFISDSIPIEDYYVMSPSNLENRIITFIDNNNFDSEVLVFSDYIGMGKSTILKYALNKVNLNTEKPEIVVIDFMNFFISNKKNTTEKYLLSSIKSVDEEELLNSIKSSVDDYWWYITKQLDTVLDDSISIENEISDFWLWLLNSSLISTELYRLLFPIKKFIQNKSEKKLLSIRETIYNTFSFENIFYYKLFQLKYLMEKKIISIKSVIIDNVDVLLPFIQNHSLSISIEIKRILDVNVLITISPQSIMIGKSSEVEIISYQSVNPFEIISKRIEYLYNNDNEFWNLTQDFINSIYNNRKWKELLITTSGNNIRYFNRNLYNLMLSPYIVTNNSLKEFKKINNLIFYLALFFSDSGSFYDRSFTNLIANKKLNNDFYYSNIKIRIIYFLMKNINGIEFYMLFNELKNFGYTDSEITSAMNDLIDKKKTIINSQIVLYNNATIKYKHKIKITLLGRNYFEILLKDAYYYFVSLLDNEYYNNSSINIARSIDKVLINLEELDFIEINNYISNSTIENYKAIYESDKSISFLLRKNLYSYFSNVLNYKQIQHIDIERTNYIEYKINSLLNNNVS